MDKLVIRQEEEHDYVEVYNLIKSAFEKEIYSDKDEENLVNRLRGSDAFVKELVLVAEIGDTIVGHIMFTKIHIDKKLALALAPVSVKPEYQGQKIGSKLINEGHRIAKELGYKLVLVLGHEKYYPKFGYKKACNYGIKAPFEVEDENFMVLELVENSAKEFKGSVEYAKEFFEK